MLRRVVVGAVAWLVLGGCGPVDGAQRARAPEDASASEGSSSPRPDAREASLDAPPPLTDLGLDVITGPYSSTPCDGGTLGCPGGFSPVTIPARTPAGTLTFNHAWLSYTVGATVDTRVGIGLGTQPGDLPLLMFSLPGNPLDPSGAGAAGPGDYDIHVVLEQCGGRSRYLYAPGTVHVYAHDLVTASDGSYVTRFDASLTVSAWGWQIDTRFEISNICGITPT